MDLNFYQYLPHYINPIAFSVGFFSIRWYALMYLIAFAVVYFLLNWRIKKGESSFNKDLIVDVVFYSVLGVIIGGRLGYVVFYNLPYFINNPLEIFLPVQNTGDGLIITGFYGMSFFGGLIGVALGLYILIKKNKISFWKLADFIIPAIPAGYFFGRIGNFLNGELYGRATDKFWGMYFPSDPLRLLRHPSQLYEAFFEGIVLFIILWVIRNKFADKFGYKLVFYLFGYGFFRFFIEFFREPDPLRLGSLTEVSPQIGLIFGSLTGGLTLGQIFSVILMFLAVYIYFWGKNKKVV